MNETSEPVPAMKQPLRLNRDGMILFASRFVRMFAYGLLSVVLMLYLLAAGLTSDEVGLLMTLTLLGDTVLTFWLSIHADRFGRRRTLVIGALLMLLAGLTFSFTRSFLLLLLAATVGVISPSGSEVGPFLSVEQAALSELVPSNQRTRTFAWYHLVGFCAGALGAFAGGSSVELARSNGWQGADAYRFVLWGYSACGVLLAGLFLALRPVIEPAPVSASADAPLDRRFGLHQSRPVVARLSMLFALDAFGGGFILQSITAFWLHQRFGVGEAELGQIFLGANLLSGASALAAGGLAQRFGLINTMVFTHLPSNILLMLLPFMPDINSAVILLLLRYAISQMDVPTRQAYTMAVVLPDERAAAAGVTSVARSIGGAVSPYLSTFLVVRPGWMAAPFLLAGGIKVVYDVLLYRAFSSQHEVDHDASIRR